MKKQISFGTLFGVLAVLVFGMGCAQWTHTEKWSPDGLQMTTGTGITIGSPFNVNLDKPMITPPSRQFGYSGVTYNSSAPMPAGHQDVETTTTTTIHSDFNGTTVSTSQQYDSDELVVLRQYGTLSPGNIVVYGGAQWELYNDNYGQRRARRYYYYPDYPTYQVPNMGGGGWGGNGRGHRNVQRDPDGKVVPNKYIDPNKWDETRNGNKNKKNKQ